MYYRLPKVPFLWEGFGSLAFKLGFRRGWFGPSGYLGIPTFCIILNLAWKVSGWLHTFWTPSRTIWSFKFHVPRFYQSMLTEPLQFWAAVTSSCLQEYSEDLPGLWTYAGYPLFWFLFFFFFRFLALAGTPGCLDAGLIFQYQLQCHCLAKASGNLDVFFLPSGFLFCFLRPL